MKNKINKCHLYILIVYTLPIIIELFTGEIVKSFAIVVYSWACFIILGVVNCVNVAKYQSLLRKKYPDKYAEKVKGNREKVILLLTFRYKKFLNKFKEEYDENEKFEDLAPYIKRMKNFNKVAFIYCALLAFYPIIHAFIIVLIFNLIEFTKIMSNGGT